MNLPFVAMTMPGPMEFFVIFLVVIVLFGAKRLPELARSLGKSAVEFKKARREFESEIRDSTSADLAIEDEKDAKPQSAETEASSTRPDRS